MRAPFLLERRLSDGCNGAQSIYWLLFTMAKLVLRLVGNG